MSWSEFAEAASPRVPEAENVTELEIFHDVFRVARPGRGVTKVCAGPLCCLVTMEEELEDQVIIGAFRGLHTAYGEWFDMTSRMLTNIYSRRVLHGDMPGDWLKTGYAVQD